MRMLSAVGMRSHDNGKVTMGDIARAAGLSPMTVSRVLSNNSSVKEAHRKRVLAVAKRLNYHMDIIARQLRAQHTFQLGLWPRSAGWSARFYFGQILQGIQQVLTGTDYHISLLTAFRRTSTMSANVSISATSDGSAG